MSERLLDRFYRDLWDVRLDIARAFEAPDGTAISDKARLMAAQRAIDRLIFCYFLIEADLIHGVDDAGDRISLTPGEVFDGVLDDDFYSVLTGTVFEHLGSEGWTEIAVTEAVRIACPRLNEELFPTRVIATADGDPIRERDLDGTGYDWSRLLEELNRYDWTVETPSADGTRTTDGVHTADAGGEPPDRLSPAVLGHVFETFVVTVSERSGDEALTLGELDRMAGGKQLRDGNRQVGAYYTPSYVAEENARETLWHRLGHELADDFDVDPGDVPPPDAFFERLHDGSFPFGPADADEALGSMTVLDPAAGGGAFLLAAGDVLEGWRRRCTDESRADLRRDIARRSLYGVDLLEGAIEVCRLRLWLWLVGATTVDLGDGPPDVEPLPNIDANVRQGNSLVGVTARDDAALPDRVEWIDGETTAYPEALEEYRETIEEYRTASGSRASELRTRLAQQRRVLRTELDRVYAGERDVSVEAEVGSRQELTRLASGVTERVKCNLDFDSPMTDDERRQVASAGFREQRNWPTTAYHSDVRRAGSEDVEAIFEVMDGRGTVSVERPLAPADVATLDPFHWVFEFPTAGDAFDVIVGNPPHGSALDPLGRAIHEDVYTLVEDSREVAKVFTERGWTLTRGELSYVVPKSSTYNSNWGDFRAFCLPKIHRGVDLGKAFRGVDHEQVTVHLSRTASGDEYLCGPLANGSRGLDGSARVARSLAGRLGTLPVSFSGAERAVAAGFGETGFPTLGDVGVDAGRGARTTARTSDDSAPIAYNGAGIQRYATRPADAHIETATLSPATRARVESPKVMAQNIIAHRKNPYDHIRIAAVYDPLGCYNFETVTNILPPEDADLTLPALAVLLNTQFVNWFVYLPVFNRAVRDMHLDAYFLDRLVLPTDLSGTELSVLEDLYGLLAITGVAAGDDALPPARATYAELQSVANAVTYELYLRDVARPLETDLVGPVSATLDGHEVAFEGWYADHLACACRRDVLDTFPRGEELFGAATEVADSLRREEVGEVLREIADHRWVKVIERGQHRRDGRPLFGPFEGI